MTKTELPVSGADAALVLLLKSAASRAFGVPKMAIEHGQNRRSCDARRTIYWFLSVPMGMSLERIGGLMGFHLSTVRYHLREHFKLIESSTDYSRRHKEFVDIVRDENQKEDSNDQSTSERAAG